MPGIDRAALPVAIGEVIGGRYVVKGVLGQGGMGVVLAGKHMELGERVAIKFLHKEHSGHADRFFREARAAARIRSEHVVRIFDVGRLAGGEPYIVMEHLEGQDLAERLERSGPLPVGQAAEHVLDVCKALAEAHAAGIVHRDLKPANIFLAKGPGGDELVKLLDFGVAKVPEAGSLTRTATVLGSPVYMSPEQLMASRDVDARSDIWSLGVVLYELLTGALPFEGSSLVELGILVREKPTPSVRSLIAELPEGIDAVVAKCLAKDRAQRFADVAGLAEALAPFVSAGAAHAIPKIRRVLAENRRSEALASTLPPPSDEPLSEDRIPTSGRALTAGTVATGPGAVLSGSLVAVSTGAGKAVSTGLVAPPSKRRAFYAASAVGFAVIAAIGIAKMVGGGANATPAAGIVSAAPRLPEASLGALPPPPEASLVASSSAAPTPSAEPTAAPKSVVTKPGHRTAAPPPAKSAAAPATASPATAAPAVNCNPPYTIDEQGLRHPKPGCF